ncbi:MAG: hypothetical protein NXI24_17550 [bacterium]|nr:hypothetical protein [bacterium]
MLLAIPILAEWPSALQIAGVGLVSAGMGLALGLIRRRKHAALSQ